MLTKNLLHQAVLAGHSALFITASDLLLDLNGQDTSRALERRLRAYVTIVELPGVRPTGDVSDYLDAGHTRADLLALVLATAALTRADLDTRLDAAPIQAEGRTSRPSVGPSMRLLRLTPASAMTVRPVRWLWQDRVPLAALSLVAGREGIGKSIAVMTIAAEVTRGRLDGVYRGTPRSVMIAATEDSWEHTIVPRLMAAGASLDRVFRVDVITSDHVDTSLSLPRDLSELERVITAQQIALVILDPLMSRLDAALDTHKDSDVRQALEPVVTLADRTKTAVIALIHVNKSVSTDALTTLMGSRAFAAVARSVLFVMTDPDDDDARLLGLAKNNLGRTDLPTLRFHIVGCKVADTIDGAVWTGRLAWLGESDRSIRDALDVATDSSGDRSATSEARGWLSDFLSSRDAPVDSAVVKREGAKAGHSKDALQRAKKQTGVISVTSGFPRRAFWSLSGRVAQCAQSPGETATNALTAPAALTDTQSAHSTQWTQSGAGPRATMPSGGDRERL